MTRWVGCGVEFITGDVIRWIEPVWAPRKRATDRGVKIGYRRIMAQVMRCDPEWASLEVMECLQHLLEGWKIDLQKGLIRRKRGTIGDGNAQRALVGDQSAREITASRYLNAPDGPVPAAAKAAAPHPENWPPPLPRGGGGVRTARKGYRRRGPKTKHVPRGKSR